jgi:DNA polymerase III sliding clamp (beta) subunit (PCNA family)
MFKIQSEVLKGVVTSLAKGARKAKLGERFIFVRTEDEKLSFYFVGDDTSVERKVAADIQGQMDIATTMKELEVKVSALPNNEEILCQMEGTLLKLKWGRNAEISVETVPETTPLIEMPELAEKVKWAPGTVHGIARVMTPFTAVANSAHAQRNPSLQGPNFIKDLETGAVHIRSSDGFKAVTMRATKIDWFSESCSIESSTLMGVADVLPDDAEITVGINGNHSMIVFQSGSTTAMVRTLVGVFPAVDKMYREDTKSKWRFDRLELIELCRRVKILSPQKPILEFRIKSGKVHAVIPMTLDQQVGVAIEGDPAEFAINATYLEMTASLYRTDEVILYVEANNKAITVGVEGNSDIRALLSPTQLR